MTMQTLTPADYPRLKPFFEGQPHLLSVYSLPSLIAWSNEIYRPVFQVRDQILLIGAFCTPRPEENHLILPIAPGWDASPKVLCRIARELGFSTFHYVPEEYVLQHGLKELSHYFICTEQRAYEDYIYKTTDLALLKGNRYANKRNWITRFLNNNGDRHTLEAITAQNAGECVAFIEAWCRYYICSMAENESLACEKQAAVNMLNHFDELEVEGLLVRIDGVVSAFAIRTPLSENMANLTFEKAFPDIVGLYPYLDRECAKQLFAGYELINKECDMGLDGLAQSKQSYHPVMRRKSFHLQMKI
ncbi:MAG: DUF2156 domain-containing protein [Deltaproteobacteria bacterium]|nr:DUF2156 domain-containing protein [Deltaproteobacteria bacterium]